MKLKEIKPGMVIHCTSKEQVQYLVSNGLAIENNLNMRLPIWISIQGEKTPCYHGYMPEKSINGITGKEYYQKEGYECVEFSDLIIPEPELSAEEVLLIARELSYDFIHDFLGCCQGYTREHMLMEKATPKQVIDMCKKWKAEHENKEPEIETEWFWQGRIFKVEKDGSYYQIKDGTGFYDTGCEYQESAEEYMNEILKEYCKTHDGEFIAVVERVCRVKAVE